jgi:cellobiose-specific phosphotransferase system component IIB
MMDQNNLFLVAVFLVCAAGLLWAMFSKKEPKMTAEEMEKNIDSAIAAVEKAEEEKKPAKVKKPAAKKTKKEVAPAPVAPAPKKTRTKKAKAEVNG